MSGTTKLMKMLNIGAGCLAVIVLASGGCSATDQEVERFEMDASYALPDRTCAPMTVVDEQRAKLALEVMTSFPRHSPIFDGAMDVFGHPQNLRDPLPYCVSTQMKDEVTKRTIAASAWNRGLPGLTRLALANELGPRDPSIVQDVASAAFLNMPIEEGPFFDIRPKARSVLASFGTAAGPWREQALSSMNSDDSLGTSAAQVAAASGDSEAIDQVAALFRETLDREPTNGAVPVAKGERLVELAYALGAAGPQARSHVPTLIRFLNRDVEYGSHFGILELPPKGVCRVLEAIGGQDAIESARGPRCQT